MRYTEQDVKTIVEGLFNDELEVTRQLEDSMNDGEKQQIVFLEEGSS